MYCSPWGGKETQLNDYVSLWKKTCTFSLMSHHIASSERLSRSPMYKGPFLHPLTPYIASFFFMALSLPRITFLFFALFSHWSEAS